MTGDGNPMLTGEKILGYKLERMLGQGGMGEVYRGVHPVLGQEVAVKVLDPVLARDPDLRERFIQEARIQIGLRHQGIVQVLTADTEGDHLALVMEYVEGLSLDEVICRRGHLPPADAVSLFGQVLNALDFAHRKGVVHRDIKPSNIMVQADGEAKIVDFGIAKVLGSTKLTRTGTAIGSAHYMSPEQVLGKKDIDHRTDIYSLGVSLYEALVGKPPFAEEGAETDSDYQIKDAQVRKEPQDPRKLKAEVPAEMAETVLKALAKDREKRWQSAGEMKEALDKAGVGGAATSADSKPEESNAPDTTKEQEAVDSASPRLVPPTTVELSEGSSSPPPSVGRQKRAVPPTTVELPEESSSPEPSVGREKRAVPPTTVELPEERSATTPAVRRRVRAVAPTTVEESPVDKPARKKVAAVNKPTPQSAFVPGQAARQGFEKKALAVFLFGMALLIAIINGHDLIPFFSEDQVPAGITEDKEEIDLKKLRLKLEKDMEDSKTASNMKVVDIKSAGPPQLSPTLGKSILPDGKHRCRISEAYKFRSCVAGTTNRGVRTLSMPYALVPIKGVFTEDSEGIKFSGRISGRRPFGCYQCLEKCEKNPDSCYCTELAGSVQEKCKRQQILFSLHRKGQLLTGMMRFKSYNGEGTDYTIETILFRVDVEVVSP